MTQEQPSSADMSSMTLCLMRHCKSDWGEPSLSDHDRPLNKRGRRDAPKMGQWFIDNGLFPQVILASTAERVRQTLEGMMAVWSHEPLVIYSQSLYMATPSTILEHVACDTIGETGHRAEIALVIAHNPGIEWLVSSLAGVSTPMPTGAAAIFRCELVDRNGFCTPKSVRWIRLGLPREIG